MIEYRDRREDLIESEFMGEDPADFPTLKELGFNRPFLKKIMPAVKIIGAGMIGASLGLAISSFALEKLGMGGTGQAYDVITFSVIAGASWFALAMNKAN